MPFVAVFVTHCSLKRGDPMLRILAAVCMFASGVLIGHVHTDAEIFVSLGTWPVAILYGFAVLSFVLLVHTPVCREPSHLTEGDWFKDSKYCVVRHTLDHRCHILPEGAVPSRFSVRGKQIYVRD